MALRSHVAPGRYPDQPTPSGSPRFGSGVGMNQGSVTAACLREPEVLDRAILAMGDDQFDRAYAAWQRHDRRERRVEHPAGGLDARGIWWPSSDESTAVLHQARRPTLSYPTAYRVVCRSLAHCAELEEARLGDAIQVKYWVRGLALSNQASVSDPRAYRLAWKLRLEMEKIPPRPPIPRPRL